MKAFNCIEEFRQTAPHIIPSALYDDVVYAQDDPHNDRTRIGWFDLSTSTGILYDTYTDFVLYES
jgi:hypothetical protein